MSPDSCVNLRLIRPFVAVATVIAVLSWLRPIDKDSITAVAFLLTGLLGLVSALRRKHLVLIAAEVVAAVVCGWFFSVSGFPHSVRDGDYFLDEVYPNWQFGIIFGWLFACVGLRVATGAWRDLLPERFQFSLARLLAAISFVAGSLSAMLPCRHLRYEVCALAIAFSIVSGTTAVGVLIGQGLRFAGFSALIMAALLAAACGVVP